MFEAPSAPRRIRRLGRNLALLLFVYYVYVLVVESWILGHPFSFVGEAQWLPYPSFRT